MVLTTCVNKPSRRPSSSVCTIDRFCCCFSRKSTISTFLSFLFQPFEQLGEMKWAMTCWPGVVCSYRGEELPTYKILMMCSRRRLRLRLQGRRRRRRGRGGGRGGGGGPRPRRWRGAFKRFVIKPGFHRMGTICEVRPAVFLQWILSLLDGDSYSHMVRGAGIFTCVHHHIYIYIWQSFKSHIEKRSAQVHWCGEIEAWVFLLAGLMIVRQGMFFN